MVAFHQMRYRSVILLPEKHCTVEEFTTAAPSASEKSTRATTCATSHSEEKRFHFHRTKSSFKETTNIRTTITTNHPSITIRPARATDRSSPSPSEGDATESHLPDTRKEIFHKQQRIFQCYYNCNKYA